MLQTHFLYILGTNMQKNSNIILNSMNLFSFIIIVMPKKLEKANQYPRD